MFDFASLFDKLTPEAWATYVCTAAILIVGVWQFRRTFRLNKQNTVFEELSKDLEEAKQLFIKSNTALNGVIKTLGDAGNSVRDVNGLDAAQTQEEFNRRLNSVNEVAEALKNYINVIYDSYGKILDIIGTIERSTVLNEKSRRATRYLYYAASEQHRLVQLISNIFLSIDMVPVSGTEPNITANTFNALTELVNQINNKNGQVRDYLDDLRVILHNDLVRSLYKKAKYGTTVDTHLTPNGVTDKRTYESLN
jgi:hypothetical protein